MAEDKAPEEEARPEAPEAAPGPGRRRKKLGNVSLHPLDFEEAVDALLQVELEPEEMGKKKRGGA